MGLPPDLKFGLALAALGIVMLTVDPRAAVWIGILLVLAALTYAEKQGQASGKSFFADFQTAFLGGTK